MSLINRIELCNFLDSKRTPDNWRPDFRWNKLNFNCFSTAILAANGIGKTSMADGIFALLTWKKWFLDRVQIKMAPPITTMTHIRLELVRPFHEADGSIPLLDTLFKIKGEPWVLGMCAHRGGEPRFYYYQGRLEDAPLGHKVGDVITLLSDPEVLESIAKIGKVVSVSSEWRQFVHKNHISRRHLHMLETFQRQGGGDDSAELYPVKEKNGESYDKALFYAHIAPQLMVGLHRSSEEDGDEDEYFYEDTLIRSSQRLCETKYVLEKREVELSNITGTFEGIRKLVSRVDDIDKARTDYMAELKKVAEIGTIVETISTSGMPGLPVWNSSGNPDLDAILAHMVIKPGEGPYLRAPGVDILLGKPEGRTADLVLKYNLQSLKSSQVLEIILLKHPAKMKSTRSGRFLSEDQVLSLLREMSSEALGLPKDDEGAARTRLRTIAKAVFAHFREHIDTSPHRAIERTILAEQAELNEQLKRSEDSLVSSINDLQKIRNLIDAQAGPRSQWDRINASALFSSEEIEDPLALRDRLKVLQTELNTKVDSLNRALGGIRETGEKLEAFRNKYGELTPLDVQKSISDTVKSFAAKDDVLKESVHAVAVKLKEIYKVEKELRERKEGLDKQLAVFERLEDAVKKVESVWPGKSDKEIRGGLQTSKKAIQDCLEDLRALQHSCRLDYEMTKRIGDKARDCGHSKSRLETELKRLTPGLCSLDKFFSQYGESATPDHVLRMRRDRLHRLSSRESFLLDRVRKLSLTLDALEKKGVAPGRVAAAALEHMPSGAKWKPLWQVVEDCRLDEESRRTTLTALSSLLFSPVVEEQPIAKNLAEIFEAKEFPIPVLLAEGVTNVISSGQFGALSNAVQGHMGEAAELLLQPEKKQKRLETLKKLVIAYQKSLNTLAPIMASHLEGAPEMVFLMDAEKAYHSDVRNRFASHTSELKGISDKLVELHAELSCLAKRLDEDNPLLIQSSEANILVQCAEILQQRAEARVVTAQNLYDTKNVELIRFDKDFGPGSDLAGFISQMGQYAELGGREIHFQVKTDIGMVSDSLAENITMREDNEKEKSRLENELLNIKRLTMDELAKQSEFDFGLLHEFMESGDGQKIDILTESLRETLAARDKTNDRLQYDFEEAAKYVLVREEDIKLRERVMSIEDSIKRLESLKSDLLSKILQKERAVDVMTNAALAYDSKLVDIQGEVRRFAQLLVDIGEVTKGEYGEAASLVSKHIHDIVDATPDEMCMLAEKAAEIVEILKSFSAESKIERAKTAKNRISDVIQHYENDCRHFLKEEKLRLNSTLEAEVYDSIGDPVRIRSVYANTERAVEARREKLAISQREHSKIWDDQVERLAELAGKAKDCFLLLRRICGKYEDGATFFITASLAAPEEIRLAVESIRDRVEYEVRNEEKEIESGNVTRDWVQRVRKRKQDNLYEDVRDILYKTIFKDPSVHVRHPSIAAGQKIRMERDNVSRGQGAALQLLLLVRIAEFAKERDARRDNPLTRHRRKLSGQEHSFIILDGLFSNLSREELIDESLRALDACKGVFQLVGLIHNRGYVNNYKIFPTFIVAKPYRAVTDGLTQDYWYDFDSSHADETGLWQSTVVVEGEAVHAS